MRFEIIEGDDTQRDLWVFMILLAAGGARLDVRLTEWRHEVRPTKRQKWRKDGEGYKSRSHNGSHHYAGWCRPAAEVPVPRDVVQRALEALQGVMIVQLAKDPE